MAYFANGTDGEVLDAQCAACRLDFDAPCPILLVHLQHNYDQCAKGQENLRGAMEYLVDKDGQCQTKKVIDKHTKNTGLEEACIRMLDYWQRNRDTNFQLEKAEDHFRNIHRAMDCPSKDQTTGDE